MTTKHLCLLGCLLLPPAFARAQITNASPAAAGEAGFSGKVVDATNTAGYTYVQVDTGSKKLWAATTQFPVQVGDSVSVGPGMAMPGYHSKTLNRTFDTVYFTARVTVDGGSNTATLTLPPGHPAIPGLNAPALPPGHPALTGASPAPAIDLAGIQPAPGGKTIRDIYASKAKLAGKSVSVRGKVVKYNAMILGKNWLHIQDGTGSAGDSNNDLTITTATPTSLGATVLVTGVVSTNRDFGAGYKYSIIIEDAQVTAE